MVAGPPTVAIAGASLVGLMVALELRGRGRRPIVLERRARAADRPMIPAPTMVDADEGGAFASWCDRHDLRVPETALAPRAGYVDVGALWSLLLERVYTVGVDIVWGRRVLGVRSDADALLAARTDAGEVEASAMVVAAGAEAVGITPALGLQLPVLPEWSAWVRVEGVDAPAGWHQRDDFSSAEPPSVHLAHVWSDGAGAGMAGAFRSFGATGPRRDALARAHLERVVRERAPGASVHGSLVWRSHAHTSADHRPVVGRAPRAPGIVLALPHGPFGNAQAVELVTAACEAIVAASDSAVPAAWSPTRFPQGATGGRMAAAR